jgi:hypothetical protein
LWPAAPLLVWGAHFTAIYASHALACERSLTPLRLLGMGFVPAMVALATILALGGLVLLARPGLAQLRRDGLEGGAAEPGFRLWFAAAATLAAGLAIVFQALPGFVMPTC